MTIRRNSSIILLAVAIGFTPPRVLAENALGTSFTYQGQLQRDGAPANGPYEFEFTLYDAPEGGNPVGNPDTVLASPLVSQGLFTVALDFGADVFTGYDRYLQIGVRPSNSQVAFTILSPRQRLLPAPYAYYAVNAGMAGFVPWSGVTDRPAAFADGIDNDTTYSAGAGLALSGTQFRVDTASIQARVNGSCVAGSSVRAIFSDGTVMCEPDDNSGGTVTSVTAGIGLTGGMITGSGTISANFGTTAGTIARGDHSHDTRYWSRDGDNTGADDFLGTTDNDPLEFRVNSERALLLDPTGESVNVIGGVGDNTFTAGATGATIGGGGRVGDTNRVTDNYGTVGGGYGNKAGDGLLPVTTANGATVAGGIGNTAGDFASTIGGGTGNQAIASSATVGGGHSNIASNASSTVGGGNLNQANGLYATVGGGHSNQANGAYAAVCGGDDNTAAASYSFAAGRHAKALHTGAFVWADSSNFDFSSASANSFRVRATNGVRLVLGIDESGSTGWNCLVNDGNSWSCSSDRNLKENLTPVDSREVLERLGRVPIQTWNAKGQDPAVKHLGPTAQDFSAAFNLGDDNTRISTIDLDGVALAAIQGLYRMAQAKDAQIARLQEQNAALEARIGALERTAQR
ncbi:MAG: tail fiber domain-containing protein [Candidatus Binatia bacterium]